MSQLDYPKYGTTYVNVSISYPDEYGNYGSSFDSFIKTSSGYEGDEADELIFYYGMTIDEIEEAYLEQYPIEDGWKITGINFATDSLWD